MPEEDSVYPTHGDPSLSIQTVPLAGFAPTASNRISGSSREHPKHGVPSALVSSTRTEIREGTDGGPPTDNTGDSIGPTGNDISAGTTGRSPPAMSEEDSVPPTHGDPRLSSQTVTLASFAPPASNRISLSSRGHPKRGVPPELDSSTNTTEIREGTNGQRW